MEEIILAGIGWACLHAWYRDRKKIEKIKKEKYGGQYSAAGLVMLLNLVAGLGALTMGGYVIFLLVSWIYEYITN